MEFSTIQLLDIHGRVVKAFSYNGQNSIDVSELENGVYFIRFEGKETSESKRFIKQ